MDRDRERESERMSETRVPLQVRKTATKQRDRKQGAFRYKDLFKMMDEYGGEIYTARNN